METKASKSTDFKKTSSNTSTLDYVKNLFSSGSSSGNSKNVQMGVRAVLAQTALRRLPPPLNMVLPMVVEKVILKYGVTEGKEVLLKGLHWVKKVTDEKPENPLKTM